MVAITNILLLAATVATASVLRRDATPLVNVISNQLSPQITTLQNEINGFPASGMKGAIRLESGDDNLMSILDTAAAVTQTAGTFSLLDTLEIITAMSPVTTQITDYNHALDTKKADFQKIGRATFVLADLEILNIKWTNFLSEMVAQAPIGEAAALQTIQNTITASYDHAIKVYSDAA